MHGSANWPLTARLLEQGIADKLHFGAQIFISVKGNVRADFAIGSNAPGHPLTPEHVMLWFSSGKPITAVAIAQLFERGLLDWNDPVVRHIPEFGRGGKEVVTIFHLLTHTAGFRTADPVPYQQSWADALEHVCAAPLEPDWVPGEKAGYQYTSSWFVLAEIVQRLTSKPFDQYVQESIFGPLGMHDCWMSLPAAQYHTYGAQLGLMYLAEKAELRPNEFWNSAAGCAEMRPGGNVRGPIHALGSFYAALLNCVENYPHHECLKFPLRPETARLLTRRHRVGLYDQTFLHIVDWGLGFIINSNRYGIETVPYGYGRRSSATAFGHSGVQSSCAFADPSHDLIVAWVCNGMPGERRHQQRARALNTAIYEDLENSGLLAL